MVARINVSCPKASPAAHDDAFPEQLHKHLPAGTTDVEKDEVGFGRHVVKAQLLKAAVKIPLALLVELDAATDVLFVGQRGFRGQLGQGVDLKRLFDTCKSRR